MYRSFTMWTDNGGGGKTTVAANVAHALEQAGYRVLCWDIDQQRGSLTDNLGLTEQLRDCDPDPMETLFDDQLNLSDAIIHHEQVSGLPFDLIPGTLNWESFDQRLVMENVPTQWGLFRAAIKEAGIPAEYDVLLIDAEGRRGLKEKNAIVATQNVTIPVLANDKGLGNVASARDYIFETMRPKMQQTGLDIDFGVSAVIPNKVRDKEIHRKAVGELQQYAQRTGIPLTPFEFRLRGPYEDAQRRNETLFQFAEADDSRDLYGYEEVILEKYRQLARALVNDGMSTIDTELIDDGTKIEVDS